MVVTDQAKIDEVLRRGVENIYPDRETVAKALQSGKRLRIYCGFDPTAPALHIGNAIQINKLAQFQALGHEIIFLIGDFTGMIGDPTDKTATRKKLTRAEVVANSLNFKKQASAFLKFTGANPAKVLRNSKWLDKLSFADLIELGANFTVGQMLVRDMFQKRMEEQKPIHMHEFFYPMAQAYDSIAMDVDLELGGNDQTFNMLCGRDLMKSLKQKEKFVVTTKLLVDNDGKKMGKSEGNGVNLDDSSENMYGKVMSWPDGAIINGFELCTNILMNEVNKLKEALQVGANPRDAKMKLALEITRLNYGIKKAKAAENNFIKTVQQKEVPDEVEEIRLAVNNYKVIDLLVELQLAASKGEARRLIEQGGIKINGKTVADTAADINIVTAGILIQRGKRQFVRVIGE
ncbi:MAG: tyrosine--tRNA ligase [Candidatus Falkowbacteria bacterium]